jgi:hypothetical protein
MKVSRIVSTASLIALIGAIPAASLSKMTSAELQAPISAEGTPTLSDLRQKMDEVGRRLREATRLVLKSSPTGRLHRGAA